VSRIIDITLGIAPDLVVWPSDPGVEIVPQQRMARGDAANVSELRIGTHTGTHVDPPVHFVDGAEGIDRVPLESLVGDAIVADLRGIGGPLPASALQGLGLPAGVTRLLLRTDNSDLWRRPRPVEFPDEYTSVGLDAATWLVDRGIRLIGVDFLSVEQRGAPGHPVHRMLLQNGVVIVEGLDLGEVDPGPYRLVCLPLRIIDGDGGPARALVIQE
jgi:arylformamidase